MGLSTRDQADTQRIPPGGTPSYTLWEIRGGWRINEHANLTLGLENILNADYRVHGSGSNGLGRNFIVRLRAIEAGGPEPPPRSADPPRQETA